MKKNTKSSITLPEKELAIVNDLVEKLNAKTKVEVIRRGLKLLLEQVEVQALKNQFKQAVQIVNKDDSDTRNLDHLSSEGLDDN